jgi:hypothetical protein
MVARARCRPRIADVPALAAFLAGRVPALGAHPARSAAARRQRQAVPMKIVVDGPFAPGPYVKVIRCFSQAQSGSRRWRRSSSRSPIERVEIESRIRLAGSQRIVAVATMSDDCTLCRRRRRRRDDRRMHGLDLRMPDARVNIPAEGLAESRSKCAS